MVRTTIAGYLEEFHRRGHETAWVHRRGLRMDRVSYRKIAELAWQTAGELESRNILKGDRVMLWAENSPEWVAAFFGCVVRGVVVVPLDVNSNVDFLERVEEQVNARLWITNRKMVRSEITWLTPTLWLEDLSDTVAPHPATPISDGGIQGNDLLEIIFTSGTTAEPRGICLTHGNLLANLTPIEEEIQKYLKWEGLVHPLRFLNLLPLSHVFGQSMGLFIPALLGGEVFFAHSFNPSSLMELIRGERISVMSCVPRMLGSLRDKLERDWAAAGQSEKFHQLLERAEHCHFVKRWWMFRTVHQQFGWKFWAFISGGATLDHETEAFWRRLGFAIVQGYGMTETASLITVVHPFKLSRGSIGKSLPGREIKISEEGEILVRGHNISPGYWTGEIEPITDKEGWLKTGDVGEYDAHGNLFFRGRSKEVIVTSSGMNVFPDDLERVINGHPEVRTSSVLAIEGPKGPEPLAVLVLRGDTTDPATIIRTANQQLSPHQQIRSWFVWPDADLPRTPTQKVRKRDLLRKIQEIQKLVAERHTSPLHPHSQFESNEILEIIARITGVTPTSWEASANLATDLKLDSLSQIELLSALEDRFQLELDETVFTSALTLGDLQKMIFNQLVSPPAGFSKTKGTRPPFEEKISSQIALPATPQPYPYPRWASRVPITWIRLCLLYALVLPMTSVFCWVRVRGREKLKTVNGPLVLVSNHITYADHALILSALPGRFRRRLAIAMEGERLRGFRHSLPGTGFFKRWYLRIQYFLVVLLFNVFSLPQKAGFRNSFEFAGEMVNQGYNILVFPEGKRTDDGQLNPFRKGIGLLVKDLHTQAVPIKISGLFELKAKGRRFAWPGEVSVTFGEPVGFQAGETPESISRELETRVRNL